MPIKPVSHVSTVGKEPAKQGEVDTKAELIANRVNRVYATRKPSLVNNLLVLAGGRPYIDKRLTRFPAESTIDWAGSIGSTNKVRFDSPGEIPSVGRRDRAYLANHAARVAEKIRQYVFAVPPERKGIPPEISADISRSGESVNAFMGDVLKQIIAAKWCWIGIDAPKVNGEISLAAARAEKIRPYWVLYSALDVVDWSFGADGKLLWIMTEGASEDNSDPFAANTEKMVRRLWEPGKMTEWVIERAAGHGQKAQIQGEPTITMVNFLEVPFVPVGQISSDPHWYDDVENVQSAILDLESCLDTLYHKCVFAQMVLPKSIVEDGEAGENGGADLAQKVALITGYSTAILESPEDQGISRYIGPPVEAIKAMQTELERKRQILFDTVGLHLGFNKNFSESAESKMFDHLDPQAVLLNYAQQIAEAEIRAWDLTRKWDSSIPAVVPKYATKFRVTDLYENLKSLVLADNMDMPDGMRKLIRRGVKDNLLEITSQSLSIQENEELDKEIDEQEFSTPIQLDANTIAGKVANGVDNQAMDDGDGNNLGPE